MSGGMGVLSILMNVILAMMSGVLYGVTRESKTGLCELVCAHEPDVVRVVPCFVLPVRGCSGHEVYAEK